MERGWTSLMRRSTRKVLKIVVTPMISGISAARAPRKKTKESRIRIGKASASARPRSSEI